MGNKLRPFVGYPVFFFQAVSWPRVTKSAVKEKGMEMEKQKAIGSPGGRG